MRPEAGLIVEREGILWVEIVLRAEGVQEPFAVQVRPPVFFTASAVSIGHVRSEVGFPGVGDGWDRLSRDRDTGGGWDDAS
jgi:hypothetical protein